MTTTSAEIYTAGLESVRRALQLVDICDTLAALPGREALVPTATALPAGVAFVPVSRTMGIARMDPPAPAAEHVAETRVAILGNVDAGKSTLLGVLATGGADLDDGRGRARARVLRHKHEAESGRTSSVGLELLAFDRAGRPIATRRDHDAHPVGDRMPEETHKLVSFLDLAGHERYLRTTAAGLTGGAPDAALLIVSGGQGVVGMAREHLALALSLGLPVVVVVSKVDAAPAHVLQETVRVVSRMLRAPGCRRVPLVLKTDEDVALFAEHVRAPGVVRVVPLVLASSVSGLGIATLLGVLHALPVGRSLAERVPFAVPGAAGGAEVAIMDCYSVPGVGTVVAGTVLSGSLRHGQAVWVGPDATGAWEACHVRGLQRKRVPVTAVSAGQSVSLALRRLRRPAVRRGMLVVGAPWQCRAWREFEAEVAVLFHGTTITPRYQAVVHCGVVRQAVRIVSMAPVVADPVDGDGRPGGSSALQILRTGDRATVRFRFVRCAEHIVPGARMVFREGRTKGVGRVLSVFDG